MKVIGIEGRPGSGKTTLSNNLISKFDNFIHIEESNLYLKISEIIYLKKESMNDEEIIDYINNLNISYTIKNNKIIFELDNDLSNSNLTEIELKMVIYDNIHIKNKIDSKLYSFIKNIIKKEKEKYNIVLTGRDLYDIYPNLDYHFTLDVDDSTALKRLNERDLNLNLVSKRDKLDKKIIKRQKDSFYLDTTYLSKIEVMNYIMNIIFLPEFGDKRLKIIFYGAPCAGKSTTSYNIAQKYNEPVIKEYIKQYLDSSEASYHNVTVDMFNVLAKQQLEIEDFQLRCVNHYLFVDNGPVALLNSYKSVASEKLALKHVTSGDIFFLCDNHIPYVADGKRPDNAVIAKEAQNVIVSFLNENNVNYILLTGNQETRINSISHLLKRYDKNIPEHDYISILDYQKINNINEF